MGEEKGRGWTFGLVGLLTPVTLWLGLFFLVPLLFILAYSFGTSGVYHRISGLPVLDGRGKVHALARLENKGFVRSSMAAATARRGGKSKRVYEVTPLGLRTARELHRMRQEIWTTIAEGRQS